MALTKEQKAARAGKLTGSSIGVLMDGDEEAVLNLYYELTEDPRYVHENLTGAWPPQLGSHTEIFSLHWYALKKGYGPLVKTALTYTDEDGALVTTPMELYPNHLIKLGAVLVHPQYPWAAATLDAWDDELKLCIDCKHCGAHRKIPDVLKKYAPQMHWQMFVTGTKKCILRVILGAAEPVDYTIVWDDFYWATLWSRAQSFMDKVKNKSLVSAPSAPPVEAKAQVEVVMRKIDLREIGGDAVMPNWGPEMQLQLDAWLETVDAMKMNDEATKKVKELLPSDVGHLIHEGVQVTRSKTGAVTIKKDK